VKDIEQAKKMIKETPFLDFREEGEIDPQVQTMFDQSNAKALADAKDTLEKVKNGGDFEALAKELSGDPGSKDKGGDLDFAKKGTFVPEFDAVVFNPDFKTGTIWPELVESQYGWHIIKKLEERGEPARNASDESARTDAGGGDAREVRAAHILFTKQSPAMYPELKFKATGLSGKNLKDAYVDFKSQGVGAPQIAIRFDDEGTKLFADITKRNIGKPLAIYIDQQQVTAPTIQNEIVHGQAVITGNFTMQSANDLVKRLNEGALPVPITNVGQQSVDASLGESALHASLFAGAVGLLSVAVFMILFYRFLGMIAVFALLLYTAMLVAIFKLSIFTPFPITMTLSGIAGFILSIGIAVDANVLIFERTREELSYGKSVAKSLIEGYRRAWPSIRDGHVSTLITTVILIGFGTGFVKGFAIILALGVLLSLFTAVVLVRVTTKFLIRDWFEKRKALLVAPKKRLE
jgi:protein-export membrane protein SecD